MSFRRWVTAGLASGTAFASAVLSCGEFAGAPDAPTPEDAGMVPADGAVPPEATKSSDAADEARCAGPHLFCDDFDDDASFPPGRWSSFLAMGGTADRVDGGVGGSLAARFAVGASDSGSFDGPRVTFVMAGPLAGLRCELDVSSMSTEMPGPGQAAYFLFVTANLPLGSPTTFWAGGLRFDAPSAFRLTEEYKIDDAGADGGENHFATISPVTTNFKSDGIYHHVVVAFDTDAGTGFVSVDGLSSSNPTHFPPNGTSFVLELGDRAFNPVQPFAMQFDNIVCDRLF